MPMGRDATESRVHHAFPLDSTFAVVLLAAAVLANAMLKPMPELRAPMGERIVVDMAGQAQPIPENVPGVELGWGANLGDYLLATNRPEALRLIWPVMQGFLAGHTLGDVYPQLTHDAIDWGTPLGGGAGSRSWERFLAGHQPDSVLFAWPSVAPMAKRLGVSYLSVRTNYDEQSRFDEMRLFAEVEGTPERAGAAVARRQQYFSQLAQDIRALNAPRRPTVMLVGLEANHGAAFGPGQHRERDAWVERAGLDYITNVREITNAERILALDPDMIVIMDSIKPKSRRLTPKQVTDSPIWGVLRAAKQHRVYYWRWENPAASRWLAELAYPALPPQLRSVVRDLLKGDYSYDVTTPQLDRLIGQGANRGMVGVERFEEGAVTPATP